MRKTFLLLAVTAVCGSSGAFAAEEAPGAAHFREQIRPILNEYCFDCHADGVNKGGIAFDEFTSDESLLTNHTLWSAVLKNVRSGIMPPQKKPRPSAEDRQRIEDWIKFD